MSEVDQTMIGLGIITFLAWFVKDREFFPAFLYCLLSWFLFIITLDIKNQSALLLISSFTDLILISLLYCIKRCSMSKLAHWLIPISIIGICMDITGYYGVLHGYGLTMYNIAVVMYWIIIAGLFIRHWRRDGNVVLQPRFLRHSLRGN